MELAYDILCCSPALYIPSALPLDWVLHETLKCQLMCQGMHSSMSALAWLPERGRIGVCGVHAQQLNSWQGIDMAS